ncbi:hypothetical protein [Streptomyces mexicanus]|uniref:hypothetical protein n=1 Tax=Streptomyces mexicanus TaxID=178566 RepID=UPI003382B7DC
MGEKHIAVRSAPTEIGSDPADPTAQFLMSLRKLLTQGDRTVAVTGSHEWRPFRFRTSMPDAARHRHAMLPASHHTARRNLKYAPAARR